MIDFFIIAVIILFIISVFFTIYDLVTRPKRFAEAICSIKANGGKIKYMNEKTGTISYTDSYGKHISISVYRGYNSHCR